MPKTPFTLKLVQRDHLGDFKHTGDTGIFSTENLFVAKIETSNVLKCRAECQLVAVDPRVTRA